MEPQEDILPAFGPQPIDPSQVIPDATPNLVGKSGKGGETTPKKGLVGQFKDYATRMPAPGERSLFGEPEILRPITQAIHTAANILPGNTTEALTDLAIGATTGGASIAAKGMKVLGIPDFLSKITRLALPAGVAATSEAIQGKNPAAGATTAVGAQLFGATLGKLFGGAQSLTGQFFNKHATANNIKLHNRIASELAPELADKISKDMPTLANNFGGIDGVKELIIPKKSTRAIGEVLDRVEEQVKTKLGKTSFNIPEDVYRLVRGEKLPTTDATSLIAINAKDLVAYRRILRDKARELMEKEGKSSIAVALDQPKTSTLNLDDIPADSVREVDLTKLADRLEETITQALKGDKRLATKFSTALDDYGKAIDIRKALMPEFDKIFPSYPNVKSSTFDPVALFSAMTKHGDVITRDRFPELYRMFEGNTRGIGPRWEKLGFTGTRFAGGKGLRLVENVPTIEYLSVPKHMRQVLFPNVPAGPGQMMKAAAGSNLQTSSAQAAVPALSALTGSGDANSSGELPSWLNTLIRR